MALQNLESTKVEGVKDSETDHNSFFFVSDNYPRLPSYLFIMNYYWVAETAFTLGLGDIHAGTRNLMIFVVTVVIICQYRTISFTITIYRTISNNIYFSIIFKISFSFTAYLFFNYITVIIASHLTEANVTVTIFQKRMGNLIRFLKSENVEPLLSQHIINHFEYIWKKNKGMKVSIIIRVEINILT